MPLPDRVPGSRPSWQSAHVLVALPLALIVAITIAALLSPETAHLGPLLVVAPALTASFAGPRMTGAVGVLAVAAQMVIRQFRGEMSMLQVISLVIVSAIVVTFSYVSDRRTRELTQVRAVSEAAQRVVLRPLPARIGPLRLASAYLAAAAEAQIGGDLYAAARVPGATRLIIGDVRGKGITSISDAALLLCAFREASHRHAALPRLVTRLEASITRNLTELAVPDDVADEGFVTANVIDIPDGEPVLRLIDCGHPPPLLLRGDQVVAMECHRPAPPLGLGELAAREYETATFPFEDGDVLLLYTDGVIEARDRRGHFYPLTDRLRGWAGHDPDAIVRNLYDDLLHYVGGTLGDDAAMIAIMRSPP